ncbi:MAG TPA: low molecular weight phosphatase family protein [Candidatus Acidoferrales bacterium]|nr:low molecular weight phosphatase family protein [Candidatus Acidoferrales bacterium]
MATTKLPAKKRVLFLCLGNAVRSQMAEAIARHTASDVAIYASAGLTALGSIAPLTHRVLAERGISSDGHHSKQFTEAAGGAADIVVNMSGESRPRALAGCRAEIENWEVVDPYGAEIEEYRKACDAIGLRVTEFTARLRAQRAAQLAKQSPRAGSAPRRSKS